MPNGLNVSRRDVRDEILKTRRGIVDDGLTLYKGRSNDNEGKDVPAAGQVIGNEDTTFRLGLN